MNLFYDIIMQQEIRKNSQRHVKQYQSLYLLKRMYDFIKNELSSKPVDNSQTD